MMPCVSSSAAEHPWRVVVPVRGGPAGKSRLEGVEGLRLTDAQRADLALAMAQDTLTAAVAAARGPVAVLTAAEEVARVARAAGAEVLRDSGRGLNTELARVALDTDAALGLCVLLGDLPALRPEDLGTALDLVRHASAPGIVVPDWEGTGTTMLALAPGDATPELFRFGPGSASRHRRAGLTPAGHDIARLRCDVDTAAAWDRALRLGLGAATALARRRLLRLGSG